MSDLKVLVEIPCCVLVGRLFHSRVHDGKNEWNEDFNLECLGMSVVGFLRLYVF